MNSWIQAFDIEGGVCKEEHLKYVYGAFDIIIVIALRSQGIRQRSQGHRKKWSNDFSDMVW